MVRVGSSTLDVSRSGDGIVVIDYGTDLITVDRVKEAFRRHLKLGRQGPEPVLVFGQASAGIKEEMIKFTASREVVEITSAVALVSESKITAVLGNLFIKFNRNPYPTRMFYNETDARKWLLDISKLKKVI